jgi:diaminohydroxyphosphoribosylaminopyrimidine deaminase/5-amino-6-(5-phosphoribosylamino)uracil reductase
VSALDRAWGELLDWRHGRHVPAGPPADLEGSERQLWSSYANYLALQRDRPVVLAHLGVSLDGRIATDAGHSRWVTGQADLVHMHRLRALADAVLVGAGTVAHDNPRLTVRLVDGLSPERWVLDPRGTLSSAARIFRETPPPTLWLRGAGCVPPGHGVGVEVEELPAGDARFSAHDVVALARKRGLRRLFIEGGGQTVSAFLAAGLVDLLHFCVAPVLIGSGRPAVSLPTIATMQQALRVQPTVIGLGPDMLYVCRLPARAQGSQSRSW